MWKVELMIEATTRPDVSVLGTGAWSAASSIGQVDIAMDEATPWGALVSFPREERWVGHVRRLGAAHLRLWDLRFLQSRVELLISEIVTNTIEHGDGGGIVFALWYFEDAHEIRMDVSDGSPCRAVVLEPDDDCESGRGMLLVEALADRWGISTDGLHMRCAIAVEGGDQ